MPLHGMLRLLDPRLSTPLIAIVEQRSVSASCGIEQGWRFAGNPSLVKCTSRLVEEREVIVLSPAGALSSVDPA